MVWPSISISTLVLSWKLAGLTPLDFRWWINGPEHESKYYYTDNTADIKDDHMQVINLITDIRHAS